MCCSRALTRVALELQLTKGWLPYSVDLTFSSSCFEESMSVANQRRHVISGQSVAELLQHDIQLQTMSQQW
jgi:hypothetical protein